MRPDLEATRHELSTLVEYKDTVDDVLPRQCSPGYIGEAKARPQQYVLVLRVYHIKVVPTYVDFTRPIFAPKLVPEQ